MTKKIKPMLAALEYHSDDRGYLVPLTNDLDQAVKKQIRRAYVVGNFGKGIIRGLHFHKKEIKIFYIAQGAAKFVAINPAYPKKDTHVLIASDKRPALVIIPPGYANGWMSLTDGTILVALSTSSFKESVKDDIRYDPYTWGDVWSTKSR